MEGHIAAPPPSALDAVIQRFNIELQAVSTVLAQEREAARQSRLQLHEALSLLASSLTDLPHTEAHASQWAAVERRRADIEALASSVHRSADEPSIEAHAVAAAAVSSAVEAASASWTGWMAACLGTPSPPPDASSSVLSISVTTPW